MDIVSACLAGKKCRYDGESRENTDIKVRYLAGDVVLVCPESFGGLPIPRCPSEIRGGDGNDVLCGDAAVFSKDGDDVTEAFLKGAKKTLEAAKRCGAQRAFLKAKSPSCGCGTIYDGTFSGVLRKGDGVAAALLKKSGIEIVEV